MDDLIILSIVNDGVSFLSKFSKSVFSAKLFKLLSLNIPLLSSEFSSMLLMSYSSSNLYSSFSSSVKFPIQSYSTKFNSSSDASTLSTI